MVGVRKDSSHELGPLLISLSGPRPRASPAFRSARPSPFGPRRLLQLGVLPFLICGHRERPGRFLSGLGLPGEAASSRSLLAGASSFPSPASTLFFLVGKGFLLLAWGCCPVGPGASPILPSISGALVINQFTILGCTVAVRIRLDGRGPLRGTLFGLPPGGGHLRIRGNSQTRSRRSRRGWEMSKGWMARGQNAEHAISTAPGGPCL
jgi:hypothetical protein